VQASGLLTEIPFEELVILLEAIPRNGSLDTPCGDRGAGRIGEGVAVRVAPLTHGF
jgi:hypothetical protein